VRRGRGIEGRRLLVLEKEAVSANQVGDHYDPKVGSHQIAKINHRSTATTVNALVSTMQGVGLTKGNTKYMKENVERKGLLAAEVGSARVGGRSEYPARPASSSYRVS
jgi:hypothetical protein